MYSFFLFQSSFGEVSSSDNLSYKIENKQQNLNPGTHLQITISVVYNSFYLTPRVQTVRLNGQQICPSSIHFIQSVLPVQTSPERGIISGGDGNRHKDNRDNINDRENTNTAIVYPSNTGSRDGVYTQNSGRDHTTESSSGRRESPGIGYDNQDSSGRGNVRKTESEDRGYDNQNSPGRGFGNQDSPSKGYDNQDSYGRGNVRTTESPSRGYDIQDTYGKTNSGEREKSYALSLVPSVSHSYSQTDDSGRTLTSRSPFPESS